MPRTTELRALVVPATTERQRRERDWSGSMRYDDLRASNNIEDRRSMGAPPKVASASARYCS